MEVSSQFAEAYIRRLEIDFANTSKSLLIAQTHVEVLEKIVVDQKAQIESLNAEVISLQSQLDDA